MTRIVRADLFGLGAVVLAVMESLRRVGELPAQVPVHWNLHGEPDRLGSPAEALWTMPVVLAALVALFWALRTFDARVARSSGAGFIATALYAFLLMLHVAILETLDVPRMIDVGGGLLMAALGGGLGKLRPNPWVGIRTPWTLLSARSWTQTHRVGSWLFLGVGLLTTATGLMWPHAGVGALAIGTLATVPVLMFVSWRAWRSDPERAEPGGRPAA